MAPILGYWDIRGAGEAIRLLLHHAGVEFEDKRYVFGPNVSLESLFTDWSKDKYNLDLEFPNLPYYIDGDIKITQSLVIIRYLAKKHGLYPTNEKDALRAETFEQISRDIGQGVAFIAMKAVPESFVEMFKNKTDEPFKKITHLLGENDWLLGDQPTYADFLMYESLSWYSYYYTDALEDYPTIAKYFKRIETLPNIHKYRTTGKFREWPLFGPIVPWGGSGECPKRTGLL